jgi:hypothetical protein
MIPFTEVGYEAAPRKPNQRTTCTLQTAHRAPDVLPICVPVSNQGSPNAALVLRGVYPGVSECLCTPNLRAPFQGPASFFCMPPYLLSPGAVRSWLTAYRPAALASFANSPSTEQGDQLLGRGDPEYTMESGTPRFARGGVGSGPPHAWTSHSAPRKAADPRTPAGVRDSAAMRSGVRLRPGVHSYGAPGQKRSGARSDRRSTTGTQALRDCASFQVNCTVNWPAPSVHDFKGEQ